MAVYWQRGSRSEAANDGVAEQLRCGGRLRQWSRSSEAQDGVVGVVLVRTARPRLQLLAVEGVAVEVAVDDDVGVSAPA